MACTTRLLFQPARVNSHVQFSSLSPLTVSRSPLLIGCDKDNNNNNRVLFKLRRRNLTSVAKSSPGSDGIVADDEDGVSLGTMRLASNTDLPRMETLLFQVYSPRLSHINYNHNFLLINILKDLRCFCLFNFKYIVLFPWSYNSGPTVFSKELICHFLYL
jgi:hypothetical protein